VAALLGVAAWCASDGALAADATARAAGGVLSERVRPAEAPSAGRVVIERRIAPQVARGGTVVLRGSRSEIANIGQPTAGPNGEGYGSSRAPAPPAAPGAGGISGLDASGIDRTGLSPENAP
jgi:hypothetical protein